MSELVILESLHGESKTGTGLFQELRVLDPTFPVTVKTIATAQDLRSVFGDLSTVAMEQGARPVLHLEIHGLDDGSGLWIKPSGDPVLWPEFWELCRGLNLAMANNLFVTMAVCHGYKSILGVADIKKPTPFCLLVGSRDVLYRADVLAFSPFYKMLLQDLDIVAAMAKLPQAYRLFNCEEIFVRSFLHYLVSNTQGRRKRERIERLLSAAIERMGDADITAVRKRIKRAIGETGADFERFRNRFLLADAEANAGRFAFTHEDAIAILEWCL